MFTQEQLNFVDDLLADRMVSLLKSYSSDEEQKEKKLDEFKKLIDIREIIKIKIALEEGGKCN